MCIGVYILAFSMVQAEAHAKNDIQKIVKEWVDDVYSDPETGCTVAYATAVAEGFATATAKAFTSVAAVVSRTDELGIEILEHESHRSSYVNSSESHPPLCFFSTGQWRTRSFPGALSNAAEGGLIKLFHLCAPDSVADFAKDIILVLTQAHIEGTGIACAEGFAAGDALATALVDIAVKVSLDSIEEFYGYSTKAKVEEALDKSVDKASGKAVGRAVAAAISSAWASAYQSICTKGELVEEYDESFAYQTKEAVAYLFAEVALSLCKGIGHGRGIYAHFSNQSRQILRPENFRAWL